MASSSRQVVRPMAINPPTIVTNLRGRTRLRYAATLAPGADVVVTRACLLSMLCTQGVATAAPATLTFVPILSSVRIRKVTIWQEQETPGSANYGDAISFEYLSDLGRPLKVTRSVISTISSPMVITPPKLSRADMYSSVSSTTTAAVKNEVLFQLSLEAPNTGQSASFILDLEFEYVTGNDYSSRLTATTTIVNNAVIALGALPLDLFDSTGAQAGLKLKPVGITSLLIDSSNLGFTPTGFARVN